ncbi:MAG: N-acetylmuramoyl-L-alanine amidase [Clostridium sp.]|uniref:N-acetylmuramoyl-L-alanine amidase n=1 Tax=Clostridium sp. TaxID=1506 RepID=UPI003F2C8BD1
MKLGIDINNSDISNKIREELKDKGDQIVNIGLESKTSIGEEVFRKAILVNTSRLEFFVSINITEGENNVEVYYESDEYSKKFSHEVIRKMNEMGISDISLEHGENFYLIKNTDVPTVLIKLKLNDLNSKKEILVQKLIQCIEYMKNN